MDRIRIGESLSGGSVKYSCESDPVVMVDSCCVIIV